MNRLAYYTSTNFGLEPHFSYFVYLWNFSECLLYMLLSVHRSVVHFKTLRLHIITITYIVYISSHVSLNHNCVNRSDAHL